MTYDEAYVYDVVEMYKNTSNTEMSGGVANSYVITYTTPLTGCSNQSTQTLKINAPVAAVKLPAIIQSVLSQWDGDSK